mgnify:CR=1 FL=1
MTGGITHTVTVGYILIDVSTDYWVLCQGKNDYSVFGTRSTAKN